MAVSNDINLKRITNSFNKDALVVFVREYGLIIFTHGI